MHKLDGLYGSIVIRQAPSKDPNSHLYDYDLTTHVILLSDWLHEDAMERFPGRLAVNQGQDPDTLLINGKGQFRVQLNIHFPPVDNSPFRLSRLLLPKATCNFKHTVYYQIKILQAT